MELTLEEMGIEVKGAAATIRGFQELLRGIDTEESLDESTDEELYTAAWELFSKTVKEMLRYKAFALWSEPDDVTVHILETSEKCEMWIKDAERLFAENPIVMTESWTSSHGVTDLSVKSPLSSFLNFPEMNLIIPTISRYPKRGLSSFSRIVLP